MKSFLPLPSELADVPQRGDVVAGGGLDVVSKLPRRDLPRAGLFSHRRDGNLYIPERVLASSAEPPPQIWLTEARKPSHSRERRGNRPGPERSPASTLGPAVGCRSGGARPVSRQT